MNRRPVCQLGNGIERATLRVARISGRSTPDLEWAARRRPVTRSVTQGIPKL
ncbi:Unknown protein sequence [Pseudomonas amygdali pv. morsprunorum]|nr:Unknown protein sequence [Pseudomonas amygdali pv. morsprunorum]